MKLLLQSFPPIASATARILILGSMPGKKSLQMNQYYAHPQNLFWPFMAEILGFEKNLDYQQRTSKLIEHDIALWDVLQHCHRQGSLDSDIENDSMVPNDLAKFFSEHSAIRNVFFNGKKAQQVFNKNVLPNIKKKFPYLSFHGLPSTSPANASIPKQTKLDRWRLILNSSE